MKPFKRVEKAGTLIIVIVVGVAVVAAALFVFYGKNVTKCARCEGCGKVYKTESRRTPIFSSEKDADKTEGCCNFMCEIAAGMKKNLEAGMKDFVEDFAKDLADGLGNMTDDMIDNAAWESAFGNDSDLSPPNNSSETVAPAPAPLPPNDAAPSEENK